MIKKLLLATAMLGLSTIHAAAVVYTTDATFDGNAAPTYTDGLGNSVTFSFTGIPGNVTVPPTSFVSYGTVNVNVVGSVTLLNPIAFLLTVHQTGPTVQPDFSFSGTINAGTITGTSSNLALTFSAPTTFDTADNVHYAVFTPTPIVPPSTNSGQSTIQGSITTTDAVAPEPATMSLIGGAFLGFAALLRRRKA